MPGRKAVIALTDGLDNRSTNTADDVVQAIDASGLSISTIGLGDPAKLGINSGLDEEVLRTLAGRAGGVYGYANDPGVAGSRKYAALQRSTASANNPIHLRDGLNRNLTVTLAGAAVPSNQPGRGGSRSGWRFRLVSAILWRSDRFTVRPRLIDNRWHAGEGSG
jgi:hypothetical protein